MTTQNLVEFKRLNAKFKRRNPNSSVKDIFLNYKRLSNFRVPNQPNVMFQNPKMAEKFLTKLCKSDSRSEPIKTITANTEEPFTMTELNYVLAQQKKHSTRC